MFLGTLERDTAHWAEIISGKLDTELTTALNALADIEDPDEILPVSVMLANYKQIIRYRINKAIAEIRGTPMSRKRKSPESAELRMKLIESTRPHEEGTVAEIAAKYGLSKSEVRRRKRDGIPFDAE